ncbi:helix-turn-helix domain-containing protein [Streptomyces sp. MI02-7b]|uniref:helix-turn-helix domain-containing protein n=1 Tax=Streptomyces sp. MI02-7b TaxID=462941 RepID=UPI0029ABF844|nr:helix-turn-helix domain-containing protein [Streptomyces sp. MI02-7b]MDX3075802.1 helix-turn-helix domain containing protein [Streptomyces sp. MI02-7b]
MQVVERRGPQPRGIATRARIIRGAAELFADRGYDKVSIRDIQASADVKKGALYHHFPSKAAIAAAVVEAGFEQESVAGQVPRLQDIVDAGMVLAYRTPREFEVRAAARLATEQDHEFFGALWRGYIPMVADLFRQADELGELLPDVNYQNTSRVWVAAFTGIDLMLRNERTPGVLEDEVAIMFQTLARGVATPETMRRLDLANDRGARLVKAASLGPAHVHEAGPEK